MNIRKFRIILLIILIIVSVYCFVTISQMAHHSESTSDNTTLTHEIIVNNTTESLGSVEVIRNVGNPNSKKIAYVIGVHPLENDTHKTLLKVLLSSSNLNYCYDIYIINVSENFSSYGQLLPDDEPGRDSGQNLALKYVYPLISKGSYELVVDVHAHGGAYPYDTFVFSPIDGALAESYGRNISQSTENISYYNPNHTTSGPYLTVPLNQHGIPAIYYEENSFLSQNIKDNHMLELIHAVDNIKF